MSNRNSTGPACKNASRDRRIRDAGHRKDTHPEATLLRADCRALFGLLFDAAARIQVVFACNPYGVVVYLRPGHDIALGKTGNGSLTTELGLVEW